MGSTDSQLEADFVALVTEPIADPRPIYARLREQAPVYRTPYDFWFVSSYALGDHVSRASTDWTVAPATVNASPHPASFAFAVLSRAILSTDGAAHERLRRLVGPMFAARGSAVFEERVRASIRIQLAMLPDSGSLDLLQDFAIRLPTLVVLDVLGIPHEHAGRFLEVAESLIAMLEPTATAENIAEADAVFAAAADVILELAAERRETDRGDLLSALVRVSDGGQGLSEDELVAMVLILVVGGHETTAHSFANGVHHLLSTPGTIADLRAHPEIIGRAVDELLRYDGATRIPGARYATRDMSLGGAEIRRGDKLFVGLQAANHDPAVFEDPLRIDLRRAPNPHMTFNTGPHGCLGASLARLELRLALEGVLERYSSLESAGEVAWRPSFVIRGLEGLPVSVSR